MPDSSPYDDSRLTSSQPQPLSRRGDTQEESAAARRSTLMRLKRNDTISPVVVVIVVLFWVLQSSFTTIIGRVFHPRHTVRTESAKSESFPSEVADGLIAIDVEAKTSYLAGAPTDAAASRLSAEQRRQTQIMGALVGSSLQKARKSALDSAVKLLAKYPDQPILATRVILLRAETGDSNPLGLPQLAAKGDAAPQKGKSPAKPLNPLAAFAPIPGEPATVAKLLAAERQIMVELYSSAQPLAPGEEARIVSQIKALPNLRFWGKIALRQAAVRAGDTRAAALSLPPIRQEALRSVIGVGSLTILSVVALIIGVVSFIALLMRANSEPAPRERSDQSIFAERPPLIADGERRLGAGDLANLFCLYLFLMTGLAFALSRAPGDSLRRYVLRLPYEQQLTASILLEFVLTALCGVLTLLAMVWLAKRRGASLAREIGLNLGGRSLGKTVGFGFLGWCLSLPLALIVGSLGQWLFHGAPEPANPIIPIIMTAPSGLPTFVIYALAAFVAPIFEETIFRGLFFNAARLRIGTVGAIALTGAAFGLSHPVGIAEQVALGTLGAVFAWMAYTKKSLLPGMVAHFFQNTFAFGQVVFSLMIVSAPHASILTCNQF